MAGQRLVLNEVGGLPIVEKANELLKEDRHAAIGPSYFMKRKASIRRWLSAVSGSTAYSHILRNASLGMTTELRSSN